MGATNWFYFTPYHPDPAVALDRLRREVFARGDYRDPLRYSRWMSLRLQTTPTEYRNPMYRSWAKIEDALDTGSEEGLTPKEKRDLEMLRRLRSHDDSLPWLDIPEGWPATVEELLARATNYATHSILDITHVAEEPDFAAASPLSADRLQVLFGTIRPVREHVTDAKLCQLYESVPRGQAFYGALYQDGERNAYLFAGCSGE